MWEQRKETVKITETRKERKQKQHNVTKRISGTATIAEKQTNRKKNKKVKKCNNQIKRKENRVCFTKTVYTQTHTTYVALLDAKAFSLLLKKTIVSKRCNHKKRRNVCSVPERMKERVSFENVIFHF